MLRNILIGTKFLVILLVFNDSFLILSNVNSLNLSRLVSSSEEFSRYSLFEKVF